MTFRLLLFLSAASEGKPFISLPARGGKIFESNAGSKQTTEKIHCYQNPYGEKMPRSDLTIFNQCTTVCVRRWVTSEKFVSAAQADTKTSAWVFSPWVVYS